MNAEVLEEYPLEETSLVEYPLEETSLEEGSGGAHIVHAASLSSTLPPTRHSTY